MGVWSVHNHTFAQGGSAVQNGGLMASLHGPHEAGPGIYLPDSNYMQRTTGFHPSFSLMQASISDIPRAEFALWGWWLFVRILWTP